MQILPLELVQPCELILKLVDLAQATTAVRVEERFALATVDAKLLPERLDRCPQADEVLLTVLLLVGKLVALLAQPVDVLFVQTQLLRRVTVVLDNGAVGLRLGRAELGP